MLKRNGKAPADPDLNFLPGWEAVDDPVFYQKELRRELSLFHTLRFKKVKAIAIRSDNDEVLFVVLTGPCSYAIVHLTYNRETSARHPSTRYYRDLQELYRKEQRDAG